MTELRKSQQLAKFEGKLPAEGEGTKGHRFGFLYQRLDDENKKSGNKAYKLAAQWTAEEKVLLSKLAVGDEFVVNKEEVEYKTADGETKTTWNLTSVATKDTFKPKEKKEWKQGGGFKKGGWGSDNISAKIGGLLHDAVAMLGVGATVPQVGKVVRELLVEAYTIEAEAEAGKFKNNPTPPTAAAAALASNSPLPEFNEDLTPDLSDIPW